MSSGLTLRVGCVGVVVLTLALSGVPRLFAQSDASLEDLRIRSAVAQVLIDEAAVPGHAITPLSVDGIVTLRGAVGSLLAKQRAAELALSVRDVRSVVNELVVTPTPRSDDEIQADVEAALETDPAIATLQIKASMSSGVVSLAGAVESWQERALASTIASGVRGVTAVENNITLDYTATRTDGEIERDVESAFRWDQFIDDRLIDVDVLDGIVSLRGAVDSARTKKRARDLAFGQLGVRRVDDRGLRVEASIGDTPVRDPRRVQLSDEDIAGAVRRALQRDPRVKSFRVEVTVEEGTVTLRGQVGYLGASRAAVQDARNTVGVIDVQEELMVRSPVVVSDQDLARQVRAALTRDPVVNRYALSVSAQGGTVFLRGTVETSVEKKQADDIVARLNGVENIQNDLVVKDSRPH